MTLPTDKQYNDTVSAAEFNEAFAAANKVTDQQLVKADISDYDGISGVVDDTTPELGGNLDALDNSLLNLKAAEFSVYANGNSGASATIDFTNGGIQTITVDQATTLTITPGTDASRVSLIIVGGSTNAITWSGTITWLTVGGIAPTLDGNDIITFIYDGSNTYGAISNQS